MSESWSLATFNLSAAGPWCAPLILPLFSAAATVEMGHNVSWPCRSVDNNNVHVMDGIMRRRFRD